MKQILYRACTALLLLLILAPPALATVRLETAQMIIHDPPLDLAPGEPHVMTLSFEAFQSVAIDEIQVLGSGWSVTPLDVVYTLYLDDRETEDIRIEVTPIDPEEPLDILYRVDGKDHRLVFDPRASGWRAGATERRGDSLPRKVPATDRPRGEPSPPTPPLAEQDPRYAEVLKDPASKSTSIHVWGRVIHSRLRVLGASQDDRIDIGADGATVRMFDWNNVYTDLELASAITDEAGYFDMTFGWTGSVYDLLPDLYLQVESGGPAAVVHWPGSSDPFSWQSGIHHNFSGVALDYGEHGVLLDEQALQILTSLTRTRRWFADESGITAPQVRVTYPDGEESAWYTTPAGTMHIGTDRAWREDTHSHEYGHHIQNHYIGLPSPDYCDPMGNCDDPGGCSHCEWCEENPSDAWCEGFANWIADAVTLHWDGTYEEPPLHHRYSETVEKCHITNTYHDPYKTEGNFQALLHDIQDNRADDDSVATGFRDWLSLGTHEILTLHLSSYWNHTAENFIERFMNIYPEQKRRLWETARNCGFIGIDTTPPLSPTTITSSHNATPSPDATITMNWSEGWDELSGIGGYSYLMSTVGPEPPLVSFPNVGTGVLQWTTPPPGPRDLLLQYSRIRPRGPARPGLHDHGAAGGAGGRTGRPGAVCRHGLEPSHGPA